MEILNKTIYEKIDDIKKIINDKQDSIRIIFVLDQSGSMGQMSVEAISGFNKFIEEQKKLPGNATLCLALFSSDVILVEDDIDLKDAKLLNNETYKPGGMTSLYDAIGCMVDKYKNKPVSKTIMAILTDGEENSSRRYDLAAIQTLLKEIESDSAWEVLFLGANLDSKKFAKATGMKMKNSANFEYSKKGILDSITTASYATSIMRGAKLAGVSMNADNLDVESLYKRVADDL